MQRVPDLAKEASKPAASTSTSQFLDALQREIQDPDHDRCRERQHVVARTLSRQKRSCPGFQFVHTKKESRSFSAGGRFMAFLGGGSMAEDPKTSRLLGTYANTSKPVEPLETLSV